MTRVRQAGIAARLAGADLLAERMLAACSVLALAAVLAPLLILAGLREGVVQGLREVLLQDPRIREVTTAANRSFDAGLLRRLAARADVAFLAPRTRTLAASLLLERPDAPGSGLRVELVPSAAGDPLLARAPERTDGIVVSAGAAARLGVSAGDRVVGRLGRIRGGKRDSVALPLVVLDVAPPAAFARDAAFVALPLAVFVEDFQDGLAEAPADLAALPPSERAVFAGFRLYASRLDAVPGLDATLRAEGIDVVSRAGDVAGLQQVDRNLGLLFALVAGLGGAGFLVSMGAGLWAGVERKRQALAQLRFLGLHAVSLLLVPVVQAAVVAVCGAAVACLAAVGGAAVINSLFTGQLPLDRPLCLLWLGTLAVAAAVTLAGAVLVAGAAGLRAARVEPWEGVNTP